MFPAWRLKLREVQVAVDNGRYEDAIAMLERESLREFLPAKKLAQEVAGKMVERAERRFARGDSLSGWQDLQVAERLGGQSDAILKLREQLASSAYTEVRHYLAAGQTAAAQARLAKLHRRGLLGETGRMLEQIAAAMHDAQNAAQHGRFADASAAIERARQLTSDLAGEGTMEITRQLDSQGREVSTRQAEGQRLSTELHARLTEQDWSGVLTAAEALLAIAPQHEAARQARRRAWKAVGMDVTHAMNRGLDGRANVSLDWNRAAGAGVRRSTRLGVRSGEADTVSGTEQPKRALLWVDEVGGFLVCLDDQIVLGQPSQGSTIAVPILADLSRRHAVIRREAGAYVLEPLQSVRIDGREITGPTVLADGQKIQLGDSVRLRFTRPHALSATARLDFDSHHKTQPSADAVLLMADSCVMGPNSHCHVRSRTAQHDVVLYRSGTGLQCRSAADLLVDGEARSGPIDVVSGERVEGESFSFTWEMAT